MFPGIYEFKWDAGHIIFLGAFYTVLVIVVSTITIALFRALRVFRKDQVAHAQWHADFEDLPSGLRHCRHDFTGEARGRVCPNGFECRHCVDHPRFVAMAKGSATLAIESNVAGFDLPLDRLYHRGHTWVKADDDGTLTIGLDDFASRLTGVPDSVKLPPVGTHLAANGPGWEAKKKGVVARILSPVDGEVIATGSPEKGWMLKVRPASEDLTHLLCPTEARLWLLREFERLQIALAGPQLAPMLADGGAPLDDLSKVIPAEKLDELCGMVFLEP